MLQNGKKMTLPDERYRALRCGREFFFELCDPSKTPKVPRYIRDRARQILKHYPGQVDFEDIANALPDRFSKTSPFLTLVVDNRNTNDAEFDPPPSVA